MSRILFVTKDLGGFRAVRPIADALRALGHRICVVAEGLSAPEWQNAGFRIESIPEEWGFETDGRAFLQALSPDLMIVTAGHPINLEARMAAFGAEADFKIPQIWVEDVWGTASRLPGPGPRMLVTLDACGAVLAGKDDRFRETRILEAGNAAVSAFERPAGLVEELEQLREKYGKLVLFCGQSWDTVDMLGLLCASLLDAEASFTLIPRWHPKRMAENGNGVLWQKMSLMIEAAGVDVGEVPSRVSTDALATCCDLVVSGSSTVLLYAAKYGVNTVSINTPVTRAALGAQVPYDRWPGLEAGLGIELTCPVPDLFEYVRERETALREAQKAYFSKPALSSDEIAGEILKILG